MWLHMVEKKQSKGSKFRKDQREKIIEATGGRCEGCGEKLPPRNQDNQGELALEVHHIRPRSQGGKNTPDNAAVLCGPRRCHSYANELAIKYGISFSEVKEKIGERPFCNYRRRIVERAPRKSAVRHVVRRLHTR